MLLTTSSGANGAWGFPVHWRELTWQNVLHILNGKSTILDQHAKFGMYCTDLSCMMDAVLHNLAGMNGCETTDVGVIHHFWREVSRLMMSCSFKEFLSSFTYQLNKKPFSCQVQNNLRVLSIPMIQPWYDLHIYTWEHIFMCALPSNSMKFNVFLILWAPSLKRFNGDLREVKKAMPIYIFIYTTVIPSSSALVGIVQMWWIYRARVVVGMKGKHWGAWVEVFAVSLS